MTIDTVVLPAAGLGTRVSQLTKNTCKEMLPYNGLPLIEHAIIEAAKSGFKRIIMISHPKKKILNQFLATFPKIEIVYQDEPKGLGHAVLQAKKFLKDDYFGILLPDVVLTKLIFPSITSLTAQYRCPSIAVAPLAKEMVSYSGIIDPVRLKPLYGRIKGIIEKPDIDKAPSNLGIIGRYIVDQLIFDRLEKSETAFGEIQLTNSLRADSMYHMYDGIAFDGGNPISYE